MLNKDGAGIIRKYFVEFAIVALVGAVGTLFNLYLSLNNYVREEMTKQTIEVIKQMQENTNALNNFNNNQNYKR